MEGEGPRNLCTGYQIADKLFSFYYCQTSINVHDQQTRGGSGKITTLTYYGRCCTCNLLPFDILNPGSVKIVDVARKLSIFISCELSEN